MMLVKRTFRVLFNYPVRGPYIEYLVLLVNSFYAMISIIVQFYIGFSLNNINNIKYKLFS